MTHHTLQYFYVLWFVRIWYATLWWWLWVMVCDGLLDLDASCIQNKLIFINTMEYCLWLAVFADCCLEYVRVPVFFVIPTKMPPLDLNKTEGLLPCPNSLKRKLTAKITQLGIRKIQKKHSSRLTITNIVQYIPIMLCITFLLSVRVLSLLVLLRPFGPSRFLYISFSFSSSWFSVIVVK